MAPTNVNVLRDGKATVTTVQQKLSVLLLMTKVVMKMPIVLLMTHLGLIFVPVVKVGSEMVKFVKIQTNAVLM